MIQNLDDSIKLKSNNLELISEEIIIEVLSYLRSYDLVNCTKSNRSIFDPLRIHKAIEISLNVYDIKNLSSPAINVIQYRPYHLYLQELKAITNALNSPNKSSGYFISVSWVANAKKYYDSLSHADNMKRVNKKQDKIRMRRGSDALPPWPSINSDITCSHGCLSLTHGPKAKRRIIGRKDWIILRKFYPTGPEYPTISSVNCSVCESVFTNTKSAEKSRREIEIKSRQIKEYDPLYLLFSRKNGVPADCLSQQSKENFGSSSSLYENNSDESIKMLQWQCQACTIYNVSYDNTCHLCNSPRIYEIIPNHIQIRPLLPGIYNLVPRKWLRAWRHYIKDPGTPDIPPLDCSCLLCAAHGLLMIPPHVEEYINGFRKNLLANLGDYSGEVYEIVTPNEWDMLIENTAKSACCYPDFAVRFFLDNDEISWNIDICTVCNSFPSINKNVKAIKEKHKKNNLFNDIYNKTPNKNINTYF